MTSVLKRYSLIEQRIAYFTVITDCSGWTLTAGAISGPVMDVSGFLASYATTTSFNASNLVQDLGRSITVYDPNVAGSPHTALLRQVMLVNGPGVEGNNSNIAYVCTWSDGNTNIDLATLARTG
jgi:hypothetical protein